MDNICPYALVGSSCSILKSWNSVLGFIICVNLSLFFCCWVICLQRPTQVLMLPVRRGNKEEHTDLRTNSRLLIYSLESGNLLSYLFLQYEEFFPLSSSIIKSWGQNLSFSGMTLEFHTFFLKAKQALQSRWTERFPKDGRPSPALNGHV